MENSRDINQAANDITGYFENLSIYEEKSFSHNNEEKKQTNNFSITYEEKNNIYQNLNYQKLTNTNYYKYHDNKNNYHKNKRNQLDYNNYHPHSQYSHNYFSDYSTKKNFEDSNTYNSKSEKYKPKNQNQRIEFHKKMEYLHIDILNFSRKFFDVQNHWNLEETERKIKKFVSKCRKGGFEPIVYIDGCFKSAEAEGKWIKRREEEVIISKDRLPQSVNLIYYNIFTENAVKVHFSFEADNDDTIAAFASLSNGYVLSNDRDFLRYNNYQYYIFSNFFYEKGKIKFVPQFKTDPKYGVDYRDLIFPLPKTTLNWIDIFLHETEEEDRLMYRRGATTKIVKYTGNPHVFISKLRQGLWGKLGIKKKIIEVFPHWNFEKNQFEWYKNISSADDTLEYLLSKPFDAYDYFFKDVIKPNPVSDNDWKNHIYALNVVIIEICSVAMNCSFSNLLREMIKNKMKNL